MLYYTSCETLIMYLKIILLVLSVGFVQFPIFHLEPIFHQNANPFLLGLRVGYSPQRKGFRLLIPMYILVSENFALRPGVGHVYFMLFVSISFAFGSQRERGF